MPASAPSDVLRLTQEDVPRVVDVLCEAFRRYPVMRFVLGATGDYDRHLRTLIEFFVMARALREEPLFGITVGTDLAAAAIVSYPHRSGAPAALGELREAVWGELGPPARARYDDCGRVWSSFAVREPHVHVNMIGVRHAHQGRGLARRILEHVHDISDDSPESAGVTLTTEDPANVPLYEHVGYAVVGHAPIGPDLETWGLFRARRQEDTRT